MRSQFPLFYRFAAYLALLAMLVPFGTTLVHYPAAHPFIHICGLDHPNGNDQDKTPLHKLPPCPICQHLHLIGNGFTPPVSLALAAPWFAAATYIFIKHESFVSFSYPPQARPRAPPSLV
jgi:hypothetical protein